MALNIFAALKPPIEKRNPFEEEDDEEMFIKLEMLRLLNQISENTQPTRTVGSSHIGGS